jgi:hypothetical protein
LARAFDSRSRISAISLPESLQEKAYAVVKAELISDGIRRVSGRTSRSNDRVIRQTNGSCWPQVSNRRPEIFALSLAATRMTPVARVRVVKFGAVPIPVITNPSDQTFKSQQATANKRKYDHRSCGKYPPMLWPQNPLEDSKTKPRQRYNGQ